MLFITNCCAYFITFIKRFLFSCSQYSTQPPSGTAVVKEVVGSCPGLERPELMHAKKYKRFLATMCQVGYLVLYFFIFFTFAKTTNRLAH